jgi:GNAT superfamily N-acetyltransferase
MTMLDLPHLVDRWAEGFARSRQAAYARYGEVIEVEVDSGGRRLELVLIEPTPAALDAAASRAAVAVDVWVTAFSAASAALPTPPGLRVVVDGEVLMSRHLELHGHAAGLVTLEVHGHRLRAVLRDGEATAAAGWVAVVGEHAIFDRVETTAAYRRRGHGSDVMRALEAWALEKGASTGLLAASVEGQALYARLGWDVAARMTTWAGSTGR